MAQRASTLARVEIKQTENCNFTLDPQWKYVNTSKTGISIDKTPTSGLLMVFQKLEELKGLL